MSHLVVKTTNLAAQTYMDSGFEWHHLLILKGKVFIGSFGCRNDCLTVHFNCRKRRNAGFPPRRGGWLLHNKNTFRQKGRAKHRACKKREWQKRRTKIQVNIPASVSTESGVREPVFR